MSGSGGGEKEGRGSRRPSPLRATLPLQAMHRTSPLRLRNRISPDTEIAPGLDLSTTTTSTKGVGISRCGGVVSEGGGGGGSSSVLMRRTASLDTIYVKPHHWTKEDLHISQLLHVDKASQTPEEWVSSCYRGLSWATYEEVISNSSGSNNSSNNSSRRPSSVTPVSPLLNISPQVTQTSPEHIDKFIRHRLRSNKEGIGIGIGRCSPLPVTADHSVTTISSPIHHRHHAIQQTNGSGCRAMPIPVPPLPKPLLPPRLRSSVEGLNQEIERLVLRPSHTSTTDDIDDWGYEIGRDGRRAPIAEYLRFTRSVDTQTPAHGSTLSATSSNHTSPSSISPPTSPPQADLSLIRPPSTSPTTHSLATSPHLNKFMARAPPDGCERVALKLHDIHRPEATKGADWPAVRHPGGFTLRPSQGSAFGPPDRIVAELEADSTLRFCEHSSEICTACASGLSAEELSAGACGLSASGISFKSAIGSEISAEACGLSASGLDTSELSAEISAGAYGISASGLDTSEISAEAYGLSASGLDPSEISARGLDPSETSAGACGRSARSEISAGGIELSENYPESIAENLIEEHFTAERFTEQLVCEAPGRDPTRDFGVATIEDGCNFGTSAHLGTDQ